MGFFTKLFGVNKIKEDGVQQLEAILQKSIITFNGKSLWVVGEPVGEKDANAVFLLVAVEKFCYIHRVTAENGVLSLSNTFVSSENMLTSFDFNDEGNRVSVRANTLRGRVDFSVQPMVNSVVGEVKIERNQSREFQALLCIIFPNYRDMCRERKSQQGLFGGIYDVVNKLSPEIRENIKEAIARGEKIMAIKIFRDASGLGLADAKYMVEQPEFYELL